MAFKKGDTLYYLHQDHLSSSSMITNSAGALVESTTYYPYGGTRTGSITTTEEKFTGQRLDGTGLYYYNARYYDPSIGRFISADSIVPDPSNPQSLNRYTYVYDNPLRYTDPSGNCPLCVAGALALVVSNPRVVLAIGAAFGLAVAVNQTSYDIKVGYRPLPRPNFSAPQVNSQNIYGLPPGKGPSGMPTPVNVAIAVTAGAVIVVFAVDKVANPIVDPDPMRFPAPTPTPTPALNTPTVPQVVPFPAPQIVPVGPTPAPPAPTPTPSLPVEHVPPSTDPPAPSFPVMSVAPADAVDSSMILEPEATVEQASWVSDSSDDSFSWQDFGCFDENDPACF